MLSLVSAQSKVQNAGFGWKGDGCWCEPISFLLKGIAWRTAFNKLFPAPVEKASPYLGEVHLNSLLKETPKPNPDGCLSSFE